MKRKLLSVLLISMLLVGALAGCGGGTTTAPPAGGDDPGANQSEKTFNWRIQAFTGTGTTFHQWTVNLARLITEATGGRLTVEAYGAGELVETFDVPNAIRDGVIDAGLTYATLWTIEYGMPLFTSTPGLFADPWEYWSWFKYGGGKEIWRDITSPYDVYVMVGGMFDAENFLWATAPVTKVDDLLNYKIRMMPLFGDILASKGGSIVFLPAGEIVPSIERGVVDAAEFSISAMDETLGFHDVAKYYHKPGWHQPSFLMEFSVNGKRWRELPADIQAIVELCADANVVWCLMQCPQINTAAEVRFKANGNEEVILNDEVMGILMKWTEEWFDEMEVKDPFIGRVRASQKEFMKWYVPYKEKLHIPYPDWAYENYDKHPYVFVPKT